MRRFEGRAALITGAAHGIGRGVAERLGAEGAAVAVADVDAEAGERVVGDLAGRGVDAIRVTCDVSSRASVDAAVAAAVERYGHLDVLVNNAGGSLPGPEFEDADIDHWHSQLDVTLIGAVHCIQAALPHLLTSPYGGSVVTVGSVNGLAAFGDVVYSAGKAGLQSLTQNLAARHARRGVRFNLVAPGTVRTRNWDNQPGALDRIAVMIPLGRVGEPDDIAAAVAFLASGDAAWITGAFLPVDGGVLAGPAGVSRA